VNLTLLYNDNESCHSRESGNPVEKTGFRIRSGMTLCVKSFLKQYTRGGGRESFGSSLYSNRWDGSQ